MARLLRYACRGSALALVGLVVAGPLLDSDPSGDSPGGRLMHLFAHDTVVRRVALASAAGLFVTAGIFFRSGSPADRHG
jgi:hypothetical protein